MAFRSFGAMRSAARFATAVTETRGLHLSAVSCAAAPVASKPFNVNEGMLTHPLYGPAARMFKPADEDEEKPPVPPSSLAMLPFVGAASATEFTPWFAADSTAAMLLENVVSVKGITVGLPGLAAQVCFMAPMSAMVAIKEKGTHGNLPLVPYSAMAASGFLWCQYGLLLDNSAIWAPNVPAFVLGSAYTLYYCSTPGSTSSTMKMAHIGGVAAWCAGVTATAQYLPMDQAVNALGYVGVGAVIVMFSGPLMAIKTVIDDKSTASIPFPFAVATFANCVLWSTYGYGMLDDWFIYFPNMLGLASATVQLGLFAKYGFK